MRVEGRVLSVDDVVREWWTIETGASPGVLPRGYNRGEKSEDEHMEFQAWCHARVSSALGRCGRFEGVCREFLLHIADGGDYRPCRWVRVLRDQIRCEMDRNPWRVSL